MGATVSVLSSALLYARLGGEGFFALAISEWMSVRISSAETGGGPGPGSTAGGGAGRNGSGSATGTAPTPTTF